MDAEIPHIFVNMTRFSDDAGSITVTSRRQRFYIYFLIEDLAGPDGDEALLRNTQDILRSIDKPSVCGVKDAVKGLIHGMLKPRIPFLNQDAPTTTRTAPPSLAEHFFVETRPSEANTMRWQAQRGQCTPTWDNKAEWKGSTLLSQSAVSENIRQGALCIPGSMLSAALEPDAPVEDFDARPRVVRKLEIDSRFYFKVIMDIDELHRELKILMRFGNETFAQDVRGSKFGGLVTSEDGLSTIGLLVEYIPASEILEHALYDASDIDCLKWMCQIRHMVGRLHAEDVVWGDVRTNNVLIDANRDAWVIDFGGGYYEQAIDPEFTGTKVGDLRELDRFETMMGIGSFEELSESNFTSMVKAELY